jgi:hypothetical protein
MELQSIRAAGLFAIAARFPPPPARSLYAELLRVLLLLLLLPSAMSVGKNKKLSKGRKGGKKKMCVLFVQGDGVVCGEGVVWRWERDSAAAGAPPPMCWTPHPPTPAPPTPLSAPGSRAHGMRDHWTGMWRAL